MEDNVWLYARTKAIPEKALGIVFLGGRRFNDFDVAAAVVGGKPQQ